MCHEYWMWRRRRADEEGREVWEDFERTRPVAEPQLSDEAPREPEAPEPAETLTGAR